VAPEDAKVLADVGEGRPGGFGQLADRLLTGPQERNHLEADRVGDDLAKLGVQLEDLGRAHGATSLHGKTLAYTFTLH
jgi:hypothetical protein